MPKRTKTGGPETHTHHPEPEQNDLEWVIWAAWADRISFEYIYEQVGLTESDVIQLMRKHQKPSTFRRWRRRVADRTTKHRYRFIRNRRHTIVDSHYSE